MTYREALELNESRAGLDLTTLPIQNLWTLIDEVPGWDYPLAEDMMRELAKRAGIDHDAFFRNADRDYNDLWSEAERILSKEHCKENEANLDA